MKRFPDLRSFTAAFARAVASMAAAERDGLDRGAKLIEDEAKAEIGHEQERAGPFPEWQELSPVTVTEKEQLGYAPPDNPLLRTGEMRATITHYVQGRRAVIGSADPVALWQELGTPDARYPIPPRSFLGGAMVRKGPEAAKLIGKAVGAALAGMPPEERK